MSLFQILLIVILSLVFIAILSLVIILLIKFKIERTRAAILSHRELWLYYMNEPDLSGLLSNNNGKEVDKKVNAENLNEKQYRFLVLFLNHMESMLPSWKKYEKDWVGLFKNPSLRKVYENTKLYRSKSLCTKGNFDIPFVFANLLMELLTVMKNRRENCGNASLRLQEFIYFSIFSKSFIND